jgi:hypothetical protein
MDDEGGRIIELPVGLATGNDLPLVVDEEEVGGFHKGELLAEGSDCRAKGVSTDEDERRKKQRRRKHTPESVFLNGITDGKVARRSLQQTQLREDPVRKREPLLQVLPLLLLVLENGRAGSDFSST